MCVCARGENLKFFVPSNYLAVKQGHTHTHTSELFLLAAEFTASVGVCHLPKSWKKHSWALKNVQPSVGEDRTFC